MTVYLVEAEGLNRIKIGYTSKDVCARLAQLATGCPVPLIVLGLMTGGRREERALHHRFGMHRVLHEWFNAHEDIREFARDVNESSGLFEVVDRLFAEKDRAALRKVSIHLAKFDNPFLPPPFSFARSNAGCE